MTIAGGSLRRRLLVGILVPVLLVIALNSYSLYTGALAAANTAYDRTLLASAKVIGDQLDVDGYDERAQLRATVPYSALEAFEADNRSRMVYRVSDLQGHLVSGYGDLRFWQGTLPTHGPYAALVDFYDDRYADRTVRVAVLLQPVSSANGRAMAVIQVAETLELRRTLAQQILLGTLLRQALLVAVIAVVVVLVVQFVTRPVRHLSRELEARPEGDLTPIATGGAPREVQPLVDATNAVMTRLAHLLDNQKRFVRDTAHQLRTPLAVLKVQVQSALRGDVEPAQALGEINATVERATALANQMLSLAKVEQLRQQPGAEVSDFALVARVIAIELSPLIANKDIDFEIATVPAPIRAHDWMLTELARNLLHNAIKHTRSGAPLTVRLSVDRGFAVLVIADSGPGIAAELQPRLFQPFSAGDVMSGSGLGLAICQEIVRALGGTIQLDNRIEHGRVAGLDATVRLPLAENAS
ncbi:MAG TPA: sensor histidine kinase [Ramlibacter sp.]|uniref:sensor histidine kinase n=1 Tax=Ramlibacter sp. TaxID=1917967 RepID=UPI002CA27063|nr:sensor histidine kinase [Ramlibacter sp.]HVZ43488.1 sensor histidine kinase [Ramlibacter sp.]